MFSIHDLVTALRLTYVLVAKLLIYIICITKIHCFCDTTQANDSAHYNGSLVRISGISQGLFSPGDTSIYTHLYIYVRAFYTKTSFIYMMILYKPLLNI